VIGGRARPEPARLYVREVRRPIPSGLVALGAALALSSGLFPSPAPAAGHCVRAEDASVDAGDDGDPPSFGPALYRRLLILEVSLDGANGAELPISIEEVCNVSNRLRDEAAQLAGGDGVALLLGDTTVRRGHARVPRRAVPHALDRADMALLSVRLRQRRSWRRYEVGDPVPTFVTERIVLTGL
jgi:hypothetical protein